MTTRVTVGCYKRCRLRFKAKPHRVCLLYLTHGHFHLTPPTRLPPTFADDRPWQPSRPPRSSMVAWRSSAKLSARYSRGIGNERNSSRGTDQNISTWNFQGYFLLANTSFAAILIANFLAIISAAFDLHHGDLTVSIDQWMEILVKHGVWKWSARILWYRMFLNAVHYLFTVYHLLSFYKTLY